MTRAGQWRTDGATPWAVGIIYENHEDGFDKMEWETTLTSPPLGRLRGDVTTRESVVVDGN